MDLGIRGKTAVVTASSGGMGRNVAFALAAEGANVVLFARSADKLEQVQQEIQRTHGVRAVAVPGDMLVPSDVERLSATVHAQFSNGPDILVLVTGRGPNPIRATLDETEEARWN